MMMMMIIDDVIVDDGDHHDNHDHDDNDDQVQAERLPWRAASAKNSSAERLVGKDKWDGGMTMIRIYSNKVIRIQNISNIPGASSKDQRGFL